MPTIEPWPWGYFGYQQMDWLPPPVPTAPLPCTRPCCVPVTVTWTAADTNPYPPYPYQPDTLDGYAMSTGGGAVAPVPQGPAAVVAPAAAEPRVETYASCDVAAGACLAAFEAYQPPQYWHGKIARGERPVTSDTLRAALLRAIPSRTKRFRTEGLDVGLRWADTSGVTFTVEGLRVE